MIHRILFVLAAVLLMGMGPIEIEVEKVPKSTMVKGKAVAPLEVSYEALVAGLCDYDEGAFFSEDDPVEYQSTITEGMVALLLKNMPEDLDRVRELGESSNSPSLCPGGENDVLAVINLPWPLRDAWQLSRFRTETTTDVTMIYFDFAAGTAKESSGYFKIRRLENNQAELTNRFHFDVGFRIPEFLIRWGVNSALPDYFEDIEGYAKTREPATTPTAVTRQ